MLITKIKDNMLDFPCIFAVKDGNYIESIRCVRHLDFLYEAYILLDSFKNLEKVDLLINKGCIYCINLDFSKINSIDTGKLEIFNFTNIKDFINKFKNDTPYIYLYDAEYKQWFIYEDKFKNDTTLLISILNNCNIVFYDDSQDGFINLNDLYNILSK